MTTIEIAMISALGLGLILFAWMIIVIIIEVRKNGDDS